MNLWQVWLTPSETRNRSLSVVRVSAVSVVANGKGDMVGSHLVGDLSGGLNNSLDNRDVSHSTNGGEGMDSRGDHWGMSVWVGAKNHSRVSISVPLDNGVGKGKSVAKTMVAKTGITQRGNSGSGNNRGMVDHWEDRGVVDERGGGAKDGGASSNDGRIGIPLHNGMSKSVAKTVVAKTISKTSISSHRGNSGMMDHREDRRVVDQGGGSAEDCGASSNDSSIGIPLAIVAMEAIAVVANSDRDSVGSHLMADLSRGHLNRLDDRGAVNSANRGKAEGCRCSNHGGSGVWEGCVPCKEQLRVGLRGGRSRSNDCLSETVC